MKSLRAPVIAFLALFSIFWSEPASGQRITYATRDILSGVNNPWEMRMGPDGWIYFTERPGHFSKLDPATGERKVLYGARDCILWHEAGMLGFDFHPQFPDIPFVYIAYVYGSGQLDSAGNRDAHFGVFRFTYTGDTLTERTQIFGPALAHFSHVGSRVVASGDKLFITLGEVWQYELAQDTFHLSGKIHRINLDGSIPADNPFPNSSTWTLGHRNPQGLELAPSGILYSSEHGDYTDDEINLIEKGRNYGWPRVHGFCDSASDEEKCRSLQVCEPIRVWTPTLAVGDISFYDDDRFPEWKNSILLATLKDASLHHLKLDSSGLIVLDQQRYELTNSEGDPYGRLRSICRSEDGRIFIGTGNGTHWDVTVDKIFELIRTGVEPSSIELVSPANGDSVTTDSLALNWRPPYHSGTYLVQVSPDSNYSSSLFLDWPSLDTAVNLVALRPGTTYYWRVRDTRSEGPWSESRHFVTRTMISTTIPEEPKEPSYTLRGKGRSIMLESHSPNLRATVEVVDVLGRSRGSYTYFGISKNVEVTLGTFEAGAYFVRVSTRIGTITHRIQVR